MGSPFDRFEHPVLAAGALMGAGWWVLGLLLGTVGPASLGYVSSVLHLLGLATLLLTGSIYALMWWGNWLTTWLAGRDR